MLIHKANSELTLGRSIAPIELGWPVPAHAMCGACRAGAMLDDESCGLGLELILCPSLGLPPSTLGGGG
jgi:hypothetical protein